MHVLITGVAGFIGFHTARRLLADGHSVTGIDNLNEYYDPKLKNARLELLLAIPGFSFQKIDIADALAISTLFKRSSFSHVIHLAAQAGVRYSISNPESYIQSNLVGFANILEGCRHNPVEHLVFASSSSVYGMNTAMPFSTQHSVSHPMSLYAATKISNENMAHSYSHLFRIPSTGLRFFTVYGPWGRPDMAAIIFTKSILEGHPLPVFNNGEMKRDFTYIDDIVEGVVRVIGKPATPSTQWNSTHPDPSISSAPFQLFNVGSSAPVPLLDFISILEQNLGKTAILNLLPMQPGDVVSTYSDTSPFEKYIDFKPNTPLETGIVHFVAWYTSFYTQI